MNEIIAFIVGAICGGIVGIFIMAICVAAGDSRRETE